MGQRLCIAMLAVCFGLAFGACDSSDGGSSEIDLGSDDKVASSLTEAEATSACEKAQKKMAGTGDGEAQKHMICVTMGLMVKSFGGDDAACQTNYDECMKAEPQEPTDEDETQDGCEDAYADLQECDATLGEIEACFNDMLAAQDAAYDALLDVTCSSTAEELEALQGEDGFEEPASCVALEKTCPGVMGEGARTTEGREPPPDNGPEPDGEPIPQQPE